MIALARGSALLAAALAAACITTSPAPGPADARLAQPTVSEAAVPSVLYARDGTPVPLGAPVGREGASPHGPMKGGESRAFLLELYQDVVDEKEALEREVRSLHADLGDLRRSLAERERALDSERLRGAGLESERQRLEGENRELAARLVTAQIRRLEAERLLLESRIEYLRAREAPPGGAQTTPDGALGTPGTSEKAPR